MEWITQNPDLDPQSGCPLEIGFVTQGQWICPIGSSSWNFTHPPTTLLHPFKDISTLNPLNPRKCLVNIANIREYASNFKGGENRV
jgi:hypothetical protein